MSQLGLDPGCSAASKNKLEGDWPESIFPQVLIQPRRHLFTSLRRAVCARRCVWSHESSISSYYFPLELRRVLTKVICASCIVPCCCAQVALCKLLHASALCKLLCASALSKLLCASALRQLLRASAFRMCSAQVGLCKLLCASALCNFSVQVALRKLLCASDSAQQVLPELWECTLRTICVLKSCDFLAGAAGVCSAYCVCT